MHRPYRVFPRHPSLSELDELCINTIRCLSMDAVQKAKSGHPGMPMGMAPAAYVLWTRHLRHNPANPRMGRTATGLSSPRVTDACCCIRCCISPATSFPLDELKNFRQWGSKTPGHPEYGHDARRRGDDRSAGPGDLQRRRHGDRRRSIWPPISTVTGFPVIDYRIYVIAGDGCLQEGVSSEASSLAGHLGLNNLIVLYDDNRITIDGDTSLSFTEDVAQAV